MTQPRSRLPEQVKELVAGQPGLAEHCVKERGRDVAAHLMAQADLKDLSRGERLFPRFVLLGSDEAKTGALEDHPEVPVGGRRHLAFEKRSNSCLGWIGVNRLNVGGVGRAVGASAEAVELGHVLFGVVQSHLDEVVQRRFRGVPFGREVEFGANSYVRALAGLNDGCELSFFRFLDNRHPDSPLSHAMIPREQQEGDERG